MTNYFSIVTIIISCLIFNVNAKTIKHLENEYIKSLKKICNADIEILEQNELVVRSIYDSCEVLRLIGEERNLKNHAISHIAVINKHYAPLKLYNQMHEINEDKIFANEINNLILRYQKKIKERNYVPKDNISWYLKNIQSNTDRPLTQIESGLLLEGIKLGISKEILSKYIRGTKTTIHPKWNIPVDVKHFFDGMFFYGLENSPYFISSINKIENYNKLIGSMLTWNNIERGYFCMTRNAKIDSVLNNKYIQTINELYEKKLFTLENFIKLNFFCDNYKALAQQGLFRITKEISNNQEYINLSEDKKKYYLAKIYIKYFEELKNPEVRKKLLATPYKKYIYLLSKVKKHYGKNPSSYYNILFSVDLIHYIEQLSEISFMSNNLVGLAIATSSVTEVIRNLLDDYIINDSDDLRNLQSTLENIFVNIYAGTIVNNPSEMQSDKTESYHKIREQLLYLIFSGHSPILNNNFRKRVLKENDVKNFSFFDQKIIEKKRMLNGASNLIDFLKINQKPLINKDLPIFNPFITSIKVDQLEGIPFNYINIVSNFSTIVSLEIPSKLSIKTNMTSINDYEKIVEMVKTDIKLNNQLSSKTINNVCNSFSNLHKNIAQTVNTSDKLLLTPSVNLFPIPFGLVIGNECENSGIRSDLSIILVNDYLAAKEFVAFNKTNANTFIGIANPMINDNTPLNIDIGEWRSSGYLSKNNTLDLNELPPLPDAEVEVLKLSKIYNDYKIYLGDSASITKALSKAEVNSYNDKKQLLTIATHGFAADVGNDLAVPTLLNNNNGNLELFSFLDVYDYNLKGSTVVLSACDTASGFVSSSDKIFTGFVKSFGDVGAKFVVSSLWPVNSKSSKDLSLEFGTKIKSETYFDAIKLSQKKVTNNVHRLPFTFTYL